MGHRWFESGKKRNWNEASKNVSSLRFVLKQIWAKIWSKFRSNLLRENEEIEWITWRNIFPNFIMSFGAVLVQIFCGSFFLVQIFSRTPLVFSYFWDNFGPNFGYVLACVEGFGFRAVLTPGLGTNRDKELIFHDRNEKRRVFQTWHWKERKILEF